MGDRVRGKRKEEYVVSEIKSTLDLVMEKTRHMTLSGEEKEARRRKEFSDHLRGVLQKYMDGILSLEDAEKEILELKNQFDLDEKPLLKEHIFDAFDPEGDYPLLLELLRRVFAADTTGIEQAVQAYRKSREEMLHGVSQNARRTLKENYGISGSAVLPNPLKDPTVNASLETLSASFQSRLRKEGGRI